MKKTFVLDTNVILYSAQSIESFQDNDVVIPMAVIEELDKFKKNQDELGRNARQAIRLLDRLRAKGTLREGVPLEGHGSATGKLFVLTSAALSKAEQQNELHSVFMNDLSADSPDNRILRVAFALHKEGKTVIFISKDINLRLKADALGLKVMDFEREKVDFDTLYSGFRIIESDAATINRIYHEGKTEAKDYGLIPNEFAVLQAPGGKPSVIVRRSTENELTLLDRRSERVWNVVPRNKEQRMALDMLLDTRIQLITLVGGAGTGKTLLALAAALENTIHHNAYERILVSRPIIPLGNDIGYLPGNKNSKLESWMQPIFDNLDFLLDGENAERQKSSSHLSTEGLMKSHKLELEAITYIRGRSIAKQFMIIDEAQNLTPHEIKTIVSRAGENTKIVLTGDPHQIDNPYLDASSNGLTFAAERLKGHFIHGHITLAKSERSPLAALAAKLL